MDKTWSMQLISGLTNSLKAELIQYLFHRDFGAKFVEVDTCHNLALIETETLRSRQGRNSSSKFRF